MVLYNVAGGKTMFGLMLLANGFEDSEALTTRDVLIRAKINIDLVSITKETVVISSHGLKVISDLTIDEIDINKYDFLVLPGGGMGTANLKASKKVADIVLKFHEQNKLIAAICAAPGVLGRLNLLKDKKYTCFANCEDGPGINTKSEVEIDGNIITARSMYFSVPFALAIITKLIGKEKADEVYQQLLGI